MYTKTTVFMLMGASMFLASCSSNSEKSTVTPTEISVSELDKYETTDPGIPEKQNEVRKKAETTLEELEEAIETAEATEKAEIEAVEPQEARPTSYSSSEFEELSEKLKIEVNGSDDIALFQEAASWLGTPYLYAGTDKNGVDCSAFIDAIYLNVYGKKLHRRANEIYGQCDRVGAEEAKAGDIIFFHSEGKIDETPNYAGIYLKDNTFIITTTKRGVMIETLANRYYKNNFVCFGRVRD
ncbi:MAG: C40 family peptidase [Paludibacteraceae bacterium]|nr:C40 family peptidase [Paludibacteraceae bacterium]